MPNSSNLHRHKKSDSLYAHFSEVDEFDIELYPNLKFTNPLYFKLEKGQSIYIPKGWWHWIKTTTKSLMLTISLAESEWYADTGSYYVNSESATCDANTISIEELNTTLFDNEDVIPDDLGWGVCVASAGGGGSFQVFAEKDDGTADEIMCLNRNGSIREGQAECG